MTAPVGWFIFLAYKISGRKRIRCIARSFNWLYGRCSIFLLSPFIAVERINPKAAKGIGPCIIISNHQSIFDLYLLGAQDCSQVCPVTKSWPFRLLFPFAPGMLAAGYIDAQSSGMEGLLRQCDDRIAEGAALVFYPEGQRSKNGKLGKFHTGAFMYAIDKNLPIVPMIIHGTGKAIKPGSLAVNKCGVKMEMLSPLMPDEYKVFKEDLLPHRALMRHVRDIFKRKLDGEKDL